MTKGIESRLMLFILLFFINNIGCNSQNPIPSGNNPQNSKEGKSIFVLPKSVIVETQTNKYPSRTYHFYDDQGKEVKTIQEDQFPIKNPLKKLSFPTQITETADYAGRRMLVGFDEKTGSDKPLISAQEKVKILEKLSQYGLKVKTPNLATDITSRNWFCVQRDSVSIKRLVYLENAILFDRNAKVIYPNDNNSPQPNSLIDCSYVSVYDNLGNVEHEKLIPNKVINSGWVSDDGRFLLCDYSRGYVWDEGFDALAGGFCIVDFQTEQIIEINIPEFNERTIGTGTMTGFFADSHFQMDLGSAEFLYLNPYTRYYFTLHLEKEKIKGKVGLAYASFMPFEGIKITPEEYKKRSF